MGKRRTKKDKLNAKHQFTLSWQPSSSEATLQTPVKRQKLQEKISVEKEKPASKKADSLVQDDQIVGIKKGILKSLILASLILGTELVLYLVW